jgi:aspartyl-tRNA(Asn)/glutamyl-tRNA(Gln) amidotransferase subunit A
MVSENIFVETILQLAELLRKRSVSPVEVTQKCLARIEQLNPTLNAFITVTADSALTQARQAEAEIMRGEWRGPLHGIPIGLKDLIDTAGVKTTAGSQLFKDRVPTEDAEIVRRLRAAGAVLLGKQNLHEFAYGGSSIISYFGEVRNPWNATHIAGGSSGGSAAAVASGMGYAAIGTDTAGSVREPASQCGVVGLKPTYGRVSVRGVIPLSSSLDHVGPLTRIVGDAALVLRAIAGYDPQDKLSVDMPTEDYLAALNEPVKPLRIGIPRSFFYEELDEEVEYFVEKAVGMLQRLFGELRDVRLEVPTDRSLQAAESYAFHEEYVSRSPELYQQETLRRIRSGEGISHSQLEAARAALEQDRRKIDSIFDYVDVLVTPATPIPAPNLEELKQDMDLLRPRELLLLRNTRPFNVWGLPAISVPCGFTTSGLPIGLQIAGRHWRESTVLQVAHAYEQASGWKSYSSP